MQNVIRLASREEIHTFSRMLFETDEIKRSYDQCGLVWDVVERFSKLPRFFFTPSDMNVEAPHFAPWWGGVMLREYDNKAVQDLYYLHEMEHAGTMPYGPDKNHAIDDPVTFKNKIRDNEHQASALSEMTIYCEIPELRRHTFSHPIFVDRFLWPRGTCEKACQKFLDKWKNDPEMLSKEMMYARASVLTSQTDYENDLAAFWLKRFYSQGQAWSKIWTKGGRFVQVEKAMVVFRDESLGGDRRIALDRHLQWLFSAEVSEGTSVPFYTQAREFSTVYSAHKNRYLAAVKKNNEGEVIIPNREYSSKWAVQNFSPGGG